MLIGNYIVTITKGQTVREYLYPLGNEQRIMETVFLAVRSGYVVEITPPSERRAQGMYVIQFRQIFPRTAWKDLRDTNGNVVLFLTIDEAARRKMELAEDPEFLGYEFRIEPRANSDPKAKAAADRREYEV